MKNEQILAQMITGTILIQELLIHQLEASGALRPGQFRQCLQDWMDGVSSDRHSQPMYQPLYTLMQKLDEASGDGSTKH